MKAFDAIASDAEAPAIKAVGHALRSAGLEAEPVPGRTGHRGLLFRIAPGDARLYVEYLPGLAPRQADSAVSCLRNSAGPDVSLGLCVRRMSWTLLDACKRLDVALFDLEGNAYLRLPGVYVERIRPSREPSQEPSAGTVFTAKASRIVRAVMWRYPRQFTQSDVVKWTGLSAGYVSILTKRLIAQGYVANHMDLLYLVDPDRLLDDWAAHYRFDRHRKFAYALSAPSYDEGIEKLGAALAESAVRFAWTGWTGAHLRAPHAAPSSYMAYVSDVPPENKRLFPAEDGGNVILYVPQDEGVFQFMNENTVSDAQLYIDLRRMPGRAREQADALRHARLNFADRR